MPGVYQELSLDGVPIVRLESPHLRVDIAPGVGGRVVSLIHKISGHEFLWRNRTLPLKLLPNGSEYDPNFYGGIDELLPNDLPETINDVACPDHGELWTTELGWKCQGDALVLRGRLASFGLDYERKMSLRPDTPLLELQYRLSNVSKKPRDFLWKLHAAVNIQAGDVIECPARQAQVVDLAWSRFHTQQPFVWPWIEGQDASTIPPVDGSMDFFYLFELKNGEVALRNETRGLKLAYQFDPRVFPFVWLFASYGGFLGHYTLILEPCTAMPMSVKEAAFKKQCSRLEPGESLETSIALYAGPAESEPSQS